MAAAQDNYEAVFELAREAEERTKNFFAELAKRCTHLPAIAAFWQGMSDDEAEHIRMLDEIRASLPDVQLRKPVAPHIIWKAREMLQFFSEKNLGRIETLDDAYELAHELEFSEINTIYCFILEQFIPAEKRRSFLKAEIQAHQNKLTRFAQSFGDARRRKEIKL